MTRSQELESVVKMLQGRASTGNVLGDAVSVLGVVEGSRRAYEDMLAPLPMDKGTESETITAGGVPAEWIVAPGARSDGVLLYFHGGGYVIGSVRTHRAMLSRISRAAGVRVLGLDYRLSPEHPFPAPIDDALAAYRWLVSNGTNPRNIVIGGDSAGGGLTLSTLVSLRYFGETMPAAGVCISPWTDLEAIGRSMDTNADVDPSVQRDELRALAKLYLNGKDPRTPLAAPLYADLCGLPPLLIQVGAIETMLDDSTRLEKRAKEAGVNVTLEVWDDMPHVWHLYAPILTDGQRAIEHMADFIRRCVL